MAKEPAAYRDNLEDLLKFFGDRRVFTQADVVRYTGRDRRWVKNHLGLESGMSISAPTLARKLSEVC